jgi:hypothetical protein
MARSSCVISYNLCSCFPSWCAVAFHSGVLFRCPVVSVPPHRFRLLAKHGIHIFLDRIHHITLFATNTVITTSSSGITALQEHPGYDPKSLTALHVSAEFSDSAHVRSGRSQAPEVSVIPNTLRINNSPAPRFRWDPLQPMNPPVLSNHTDMSSGDLVNTRAAGETTIMPDSLSK